MKLNFTKNENNYSLETVKDFAKELSFAFTTGKRKGKVEFIADFALSNLQSEDKIDLNELDNIMVQCEPWHGVKELGEIGFDNDEYRTFVFDYYGGGRFNSMQTNMFDEADEVEECVLDIVCDILDLRMNEADKWLVLVQWNEDKPIVDDRQQEIDDTKRIEDEAVKNFAEMLTDYAQGVQAAGYDGIGVEDIQDKLYEYLNWDIKYTPEYEAGRNNR